MIGYVLVAIGAIGLLIAMLGTAYSAGYKDAKERYDNGIVRYNLGGHDE